MNNGSRLSNPMIGQAAEEEEADVCQNDAGATVPGTASMAIV